MNGPHHYVPHRPRRATPPVHSPVVAPVRRGAVNRWLMGNPSIAVDILATALIMSAAFLTWLAT